MGNVFNWNDSYEYDVSKRQRILDPGIYDFTVSNIEKCWYEGSNKIQPCNALNMWIDIDGEDVTIFEKFCLVDTMLWKIDSFLKSVGFNEQKIPLLLQSTGKTGMCHIVTRDLDRARINNIDRFIAPNDDIEWLQLRDYVLDRDNHKCRICGSAESLRVHHIIEKSADSSNKYNPSNLMTLCYSCHEKAHARHFKAVTF